MSDNLIWAASGVGRGEIAGITLWCVVGVDKDFKLPKEDNNLIPTLLSNSVWSLGEVTPEEIDIVDSNKQVELIALLRAFSKLKEYDIKELHGDLWLPDLSFYEAINLKKANEIVLAVKIAEIIVQHFINLYWEKVKEQYPQYQGKYSEINIKRYGLIPKVHRLSNKICQRYIRS